MLRAAKEVISLEANKGSCGFRLKKLNPACDRLVVDIYRLDGGRHPEDHLGWWLFHFRRALSGELLLDFSEIGEDSVKLRTPEGTHRRADDCWFNSEYPFSPVQDFHLIIRDRENRVREQITCQLINADSGVLKRFYDTLHATDGYKTEGNTFLITLHQYKLSLLKKLFTTYIAAGSTVLDVGCGNSLFTEISPHWDFNLICCDLGEPVIRQRHSLFPQYEWFVGDVSRVPVQAQAVDAVFAGEIIEHVPDVSHTLSEWHRVLKPGGTLILTTPNRHRLRNRVNRSQRPLGADHLNELTLTELERALDEAGFTMVERQGFYLELLLNWFRRGAKVDYLQSSGNRPSQIPMIRRLCTLGSWMPSLAFGLIVVARRR